MPCLDTNLLIDLLHKEPAAVEKIKSLQEKGLRLKTTSINACELYRGVYQSDRLGKKAWAVETLLANMDVLEISLAVAKKAAAVMTELQNAGQTISEMDVFIAATAITNNETLITRDKDFKRIKELRIETW